MSIYDDADTIHRLQLWEKYQMGFKDDRQRSRACFSLLRMLQLEDMWDVDIHPRDEGPSSLAHENLKDIREYTSGLSPSEITMLQVAIDFWNNSGGASIQDIITWLPPICRTAIGELIIASHSGSTVEEWLTKWEAYELVEP